MAECKYKERCKQFNPQDDYCVKGEMNWMPYGVPPCFNDEEPSQDPLSERRQDRV
jgi:hypothetical protein